MKTRDLALGALFSALMALCSWISLPLGPMSVTLQTFSLYLTLFLLGGRLGTVSVLIYLLLGAVGLPVFSGFQGGIGILLGPTGGFLFSFMLTTLLYWFLTFRFGPRLRIPAAIIGTILCYIVGLLWLGRFTAAPMAALPMIMGDVLKLLLAHHLSRRLQKIILLPSRA